MPHFSTCLFNILLCCLEINFLPFFSHSFRFYFKRNAEAYSCFSRTVYISALAYLCDLSILVCLLCKLYEPWDLFLFTLCIKHYFFLHIYSAPFQTVKCSLLFFFPPQEQQLVLGKLTNLQNVPLLSELALWSCNSGFSFSQCGSLCLPTAHHGLVKLSIGSSSGKGFMFKYVSL